MSLQDKIAQSQAKARSKLHDFSITQIGTEIRAVRLKTEYSLEGDAEENIIVSHGEVDLYIDLPKEIPIDRLRRNLTSNGSSAISNIYMFDVLPIEVYPKYGSDLQTGDIIIYKLKYKNEEEFYHVFQLTENIGSFNTREFSFQKFNTAPYLTAFTEEIKNVIEGYLI